MSTSARRGARPARPQLYPPIKDFAHACATAFALHDQFGRARACFVIGSRGRVEQGWALTGPEHDEGHVLMLALAVPTREIAGRSVLMFTARGHDDVTELAETDVATWRRLQADVESRGAWLVDWILTGADDMRSMRFATDPTARHTWVI
jgi:hypothetical protein